MIMVNMVKWSRELQGSPITIETDSLPTVNAIHKGGVNHLELGHIIQQCREILVSRDDLSVVFAKKLANNVARGMVRLPCTLNSSNNFTVSSEFVGDHYVRSFFYLMKVFIFQQKKKKKTINNSVPKDIANTIIYTDIHMVGRNETK